MKTAMMELIDKLKVESNFITKDDHIEDKMFKKGIDLAIYISNHLLGKEKEQISKAWDDGDYAYFYNKETGRDFENGEEYYNQSYNN